MNGRRMSNQRVVWLTADDPPGAFPPVEDASVVNPTGLLGGRW